MSLTVPRASVSGVPEVAEVLICVELKHQMRALHVGGRPRDMRVIIGRASAGPETLK